MTLDGINEWLSTQNIQRYCVDEDGLIDVYESVRLQLGNETSLGVRFGTIKGNFECFDNMLITLEGMPNVVGGDFICCNNQLPSLVGAPAIVIGDFACCNNQLTSVRGISEHIKGHFICANNPLTTKLAKAELQDQWNSCVGGRIVYDGIPDDGACYTLHMTKAAKNALSSNSETTPFHCPKGGLLGDPDFDCTKCERYSSCLLPEKNLEPLNK